MTSSPLRSIPVDEACATHLLGGDRRSWGWTQTAYGRAFLDSETHMKERVLRWLERARGRDRLDDDIFDRFICAWIAFNGWYHITVGDFADREAIRTLSRSTEVAVLYGKLLEASDFTAAEASFRALWPIKTTRTPRNHPSCDHGAEAPRDVPHLLDALYAVRCNLFHGMKHPEERRDREVVAAALGVLVPLADALVECPTDTRG